MPQGTKAGAMRTSCVSLFKLTRMHDKNVEIKHSESYDES